MLAGGTSSVNGQNQIFQSGNYCYSSIGVASIDEKQRTKKKKKKKKKKANKKQKIKTKTKTKKLPKNYHDSSRNSLLAARLDDIYIYIYILHLHMNR